MPIGKVIGAAQCAIFFLDEDQRVKWKDIGERSEIERFARRSGATITRLALASQFRCNGFDRYLAWLDHTLGIRETANWKLSPREFDFRIFDSPEKLRREIVERKKVANNARMVAGYCWDWKSKKDPNAADVIFPEHNFAMQWNLSRDGSLWIVAPESVEQFGCIHTGQGLEVDYIGVVVGPDICATDGQVDTRPRMRSRHDKWLSGFVAALAASPLTQSGAQTCSFETHIEL